jgi:hypothetical protein
MEAGLFAASQRADRQRRMQKDADAAASVRTAAIRTWIDLAALAPVFSASAGTWPEDVAAVRAALREAVRRYRDIQQARNLFGYAPRYVPFLWSSTGEGSTNYAQIKHNADSNLVTWKTAYDSAQSAGRTFEQSANALVDDLYNQTRAMNLELNDICGGDVAGISECPVDVNDPQPRSQIGQQVLEIRAAALRIDSIDQQLANVREAVEIERRRAEDVAGADEEEYAFVLENGEKIYADDEAIRQIQAAQQAAHSFFGGVLSALSGGGWPAVAVGAVGAAVDEGAEQWRESYEKDKARRIALQSARPYRLAATIELRNSQAKMQTDWLQVYTLRIDLAIAAINLQQAVGRLKALHARAETLLAERARVNALHAQHAAYVLHYRVFAGAQQRTASAAFEDALKWSYLTVRAAEYQRTASCPYWNELWSVRDPTALGGALSKVQNWSFWQQPAQGNRDVISIRDDILGMKLAVKDRTTGEEISPREQFRRFVADPANRNADGNFHIRFSTGDLANPVFSSQVATFLGAVTPLPVDFESAVFPAGTKVFDGSDLYLGVAVDGTEELTPRQQIGTVVYALRTAWAVRAKDADHADEAAHAANSTNAGYATTAGSAGFATTATSADTATTAGSAINLSGGNVNATGVTTSSLAATYANIGSLPGRVSGGGGGFGCPFTGFTWSGWGATCTATCTCPGLSCTMGQVNCQCSDSRAKGRWLVPNSIFLCVE